MNRAAKKPPIKLEGAGCLIYKYIVDFMVTKRRIVTVNRELATNYVIDRATYVLTQNESRADLEARVNFTVMIGDSTYSDIQRAISFLYCQSEIERLAELESGINLYCKGSKRKGRQLKQDI